MPQRIDSFEEFWPFYLREHSLRATRRLHFVGTNLAVALVIVALAMAAWWLFPVALVAGYGPAWASHFFIEKNKPASFAYPLWSFRGDIKLWRLTWAGRLAPELERHIEHPAAV